MYFTQTKNVIKNVTLYLKAMKHFVLFVAILLLLWGATDDRSLAQNSQVAPPLCYMETTDGKIIDLGRLCGQQPGNAPVAVCDSDLDIVEAADLPISNVNYDGNLLKGRVTNKSCKSVRAIRVNYQVFDELGNAIDNGYIEATPAVLEPGKVASFEGRTIAGARVETTYVEWSEVE